MLNHIVVMGRLVRDPELRHTQTGIPVARFTVACDQDFKNKNTGERNTDFIDCVAWRSTGEFVSKYFSKGRMAVVEGRLEIKDWTDKEGNKRRTAQIKADSVYSGIASTRTTGPPRIAPQQSLATTTALPATTVPDPATPSQSMKMMKNCPSKKGCWNGSRYL